MAVGSGTGVGSQGSPRPSSSVLVWASFETPGQLSIPSTKRSRSRLSAILMPDSGGTHVKAISVC